MKLFFLVMASLCMGVSVSVTSAQEDLCPADVDQPLNVIQNVCSGTARNQVCYAFGDVLLESHTQSALDTTGDINVDTLETLQLNGGVVFLRLQADLPADDPNQTVDLLAWGDVTLINNIPPMPNVTATTTSNARVRTVPFAETDTSVINVIPAGVAIQVLGRNEFSDWIYIDMGTYSNRGFTTGWTSTQVVTITGDRNDLPIIDYENPPIFPEPMSDFTIITGNTPSACPELPRSGVLLQTSPGAPTARLTINGVDVFLRGAALMDTADEVFNMYLLDGQGKVSIGEEQQLLIGGTMTRAIAF